MDYDDLYIAWQSYNNCFYDSIDNWLQKTIIWK